MNLPPVIQLRQDDTHRLVPSKYAFEEQSALSRLVDEESELQQLSELDARQIVVYSGSRVCCPASASMSWCLEFLTPTL